ncbi:MAG: hypothetical protein IJO65_13980, partial [Lachnospiraceae bacterium]|nr:hypothetical protein [Lachnospiraceae bacterium]
FYRSYWEQTICTQRKAGYMATESNFISEKCVVYVFAIYTKRHAEMVEKLKVLWEYRWDI